MCNQPVPLLNIIKQMGKEVEEMTEDGQGKKGMVYLNGKIVAGDQIKAEDAEAIRQAMKTIADKLSLAFQNLKGNLNKSYSDLQEDTVHVFSPDQLQRLRNHLPKLHTDEEGRIKVTMNNEVILDIAKVEAKKED